MSRNPRPCKYCGQPKPSHKGLRLRDYRPAKRTEPLRADRGSAPLDDVIAQLQSDPSTDLLIERDGEAVAVIISWDRLMRLRRMIARLSS